MSDQRFDQDLRSVLLEDAPRDVPDELRHRVAAIADAHPIAGGVSRPAWRHPVPLWIGAAAVLLVVLAIAAWRFGPVSQPGFGGPPSPSPSVGASTSPSGDVLSSPSPSSSNSVGVCRGVDIKGLILGWQGAAGSRIADIQVTNIAARACLMRGTPGLQLLDAGGRVLIDSASAGPSGQPHVTSADAAFEVAPGGRLQTQVQASNYCGKAPALPLDIAFSLPSDGGPFVATPGPGVSSTNATPPCLGSTGNQITMNGWRR